MAYDPQRDRPRHRPDVHETSIVDALLDGATDPPRHNGHEPHGAPSYGSTPEPPNAWSERLLYSAGISSVLGTAAGLAAMWWLWKACKRRMRRSR